MDKVEKIRKLIKIKKLTYDEFAKLIGKSKPTIVNYFNGKSKIDIDTIEYIAKALGVPVSYFFDESEAPPIIQGQNNIIQNGSANTVKMLIQTKDSEIEKLKLENEQLRKQIELLKEIIEQKDEIINLLKGKNYDRD